MPNPGNIRAPASLIGSGRSGTTLVTAILRRHRDVQALGETGNLIFSPLFHIEKTLPLCGPGYDKASAPSAAVDQVHRLLIDLFPSDAPRWFHKPIMMPAARRMFKEDADFHAWFWEACERLFPDARWFTVVRDWRDVARSSMRRWNWTADVAIRSQARLAGMLLHPTSRLGLALDFATLVGDPEGSTRRLLDFLDLPWDPACLTAFDQAHAPNRDDDLPDAMAEMRERGFTHRDEITEGLRSPLMDRLQHQLLHTTPPLGSSPSS